MSIKVKKKFQVKKNQPMEVINEWHILTLGKLQYCNSVHYSIVILFIFPVNSY